MKDITKVMRGMVGVVNTISATLKITTCPFGVAEIGITVGTKEDWAGGGLLREHGTSIRKLCIRTPTFRRLS